MPNEDLPPDPDAVEKWKQLPQNNPSNEALPPATDGFPRWLWWILGLIVVLGIIGAIVQSGV